MKKIPLAAAIVGVASAQINFTSPEVSGNVVEPFLDEISGMFAMRNSDNESKIITCHDSDSEYLFVLKEDGSYSTRIDLEGDNWSDVEEISGYTKNGTNYIVLFEFGDNGASRDKKYIFRFPEPTLTSGTTIVNNWDKISYRLPATPVLEKGQNAGDFEGAFIDVVDNKMYFFSKRMPVNYIYSLPIQDTYSGTQTLTFEGTMHNMVAEETGGVISPANCVGAALSEDGNHALIKTYNMVFQFVRPEGRTWSDVLVNDRPVVEPNYVGRGSAPQKEPQGESICFAPNDDGYYTVSEFRRNDEVPLFFYPREVTLPPFEAKYSKDAAHTHAFIVTEGYNWTLEASTNLRDWVEVDSPFTTFSNGDGTATYIYTRQDKIREFFRFSVRTPLLDLKTFVRSSIITAIGNQDPANNQIFNDYTTPSNLIRNTSNFLHDKEGVTGLIVWNSRSVGSGKYLGGAAITPQHIIFTQHASYLVGDDVYFVTRDNELVVRRVTHIQGNGFTDDESDYVIGLLNSPLPSSIEPLEMMPADTYKYFDNWASDITLYDRLDYVWVDQLERSRVGTFKTINMMRLDDPTPDVYSHYGHAKYTATFGLTVPDIELDAWRKDPIPGDSGSVCMFLIGDKLVAAAHISRPAAGDWFGQLRNMNDFNRMIVDVDAKAFINTGFQVTQTDLSAFKTYR